jgi:hypothetical protein
VPLVGSLTILRRALKSERTSASYAPRGATISLLPSYGSAGHNIYDPMTPFHISPRQNIGLVPIDHGDQIAVGLLLTKAEFDEIVLKLF